MLVKWLEQSLALVKHSINARFAMMKSFEIWQKSLNFMWQVTYSQGSFYII